MSFRGSDIPVHESPQLRKAVGAITEYLARQDTRTSGGSNTDNSLNKTAANARVLVQTNDAAGEVRHIPIQPAATILVMAFTGSPTVKDRKGNLKLDGDFIPRNIDEVLTLTSDGINWVELSRGSAGFPTFVPAARFGAVPDTGIDMTGSIGSALALIQPGETLFFSPGIYVVSESFVHETLANIYAYGATWHYGSTDLTTPALTVGGTTEQMSRINITGLKIVRDYSDDLSIAAAAGAGIGFTAFKFLGNNRCSYDDLFVQGFDKAFYLVGNDGATSKGCSENSFRSLRALDCRYSFTLEQTGTLDFVNENSFYDCEHQHSSSFSAAHAVNDTYGFENCRLLWGATANRPNNNRFYGCNWEAPSGRPSHRKVRVQGSENGWYHCRWETHNAVTADPGADGIDITIGKAATATTFMTRNIFFHGQEMNTIVDSAQMEFIGTTTANNKNQFFSGWSSIIAGGNNAPNLSLYGGSDTTDMIEHKMVTGAASRTMLSRAKAPDGSYGFHGFYDNSTTLRNYLSLDTATLNSVWNLLINQGLVIGAMGQFYPSGSDLKMFPITSGGRLLAVGNTASDTPVLAARNSTSSNRSLGVYLSTDVIGWSIAATGTSAIAPQVWYASGTEQNRLWMSSGSPYPLIINHGLTVNGADATAGDFKVFEGGGGAFTLLFVDTTNQDVVAGLLGVSASGTAKVHLGGTKHYERVAFPRTTTAGDATIGPDDYYYAVTSTAAARTLTLPARSAVDPGHTIVVKDESLAASVVNTITVQRAGADTIDGATTAVISTAGGSIRLYAGAATQWFTW